MKSFERNRSSDVKVEGKSPTVSGDRDRRTRPAKEKMGNFDDEASPTTAANTTFTAATATKTKIATESTDATTSSARRSAQIGVGDGDVAAEGADQAAKGKHSVAKSSNAFLKVPSAIGKVKSATKLTGKRSSNRSTNFRRQGSNG